MSKQCQVCKTINHSAANHCSICGNELPDKELSEEEKLHIELHEAKLTIKGLNKALFEMQMKAAKSLDLQSEIDDFEEKLAKEKRETSKYANLFSKSEKELIAISNQLKDFKSSRNIWIVTLFIICIALGVSIMSASQSSDDYSGLKDKCISLEAENDTILQKVISLENDKNYFSKRIDTISTYYPLIIKSLKIGNSYKDGTIETDFGNTLYSSTSMYLCPQIEYLGLKNTTVTLYIKLYNEGVLSQGPNSPDGFTTKRDIFISDRGRYEITGWGNEIKGNWSKGNYRYEIWYNDMCLKSLNFKLY